MLSRKPLFVHPFAAPKDFCGDHELTAAPQLGIFLDELGELSLACQAKILRLIEEQRFERVGGTELIEVNVRIIAATNNDMPTAVSKNEFREDLFYRLNVLMIELPPLRQRPDDIL